MERLLRMSKERFVEECLVDARKALEQIADAVNDAPDGNVINGSEVAVRDAAAEFRRTSFEKALQMRVDETEGAFSPSEGRIGKRQAKQGTLSGQRGNAQRARAGGAPVLVGQRRRG